MPPMLPRQTRRNTSFGLPMRVKVCPIIRDLRFRAAKPHSIFNERLVPKYEGSGDRGLSSLANLLFFHANRARRRSCASEPKDAKAQKTGLEKQALTLVWPYSGGASLRTALGG